MKISRMGQFFIIINRTQLDFFMINSCLDEKFITPSQSRLALKKKIMRKCQCHEIFIKKNKPKNEK